MAVNRRKETTIAGGGEVIGDLLQRKNLTRAFIAHKLKVTRGAITQYVQNLRGITITRIKEIAVAAGEPPEVLVNKCLRKAHPELFESSLGRAAVEAEEILSGDHGELSPENKNKLRAD